MQLKGQVLGYDDIATFELSDVIGSYKEDGVLYIQTSFGETPIVYSTIEPILPIQEKEAIQEGEEENDDEVLREAGYDPDEVGTQMKAAAEAALARVALSGRVDMITLELTTPELAALNIVSQLNEDPHGRLFDYDKVSPLFTENEGRRMHEETKIALAAVVNRRLG